MATALSLESLQAYHAGLFKALIPLLDEIQLRNTSPDLHVTLIKAFYDGIPNSFAYKLKVTSCSTWMAAQNNFQDCQTNSNVRLAVSHANKAADSRKKYAQFEGKQALSARSARIPQISKTTPTHPFRTSQPSRTNQPPVEPPPKVLDTGQP